MNMPLSQVPWLADEPNQPPTHETIYVNIVNDYKCGFITAISIASKRAEAIEGWNTGFSGNAASVDINSILNILNEEE